MQLSRIPALFKGEYINADNIAKSLEKDILNYIERNIQAANTNVVQTFIMYVH
jgi:hypothetical protein